MKRSAKNPLPDLIPQRSNRRQALTQMRRMCPSTCGAEREGATEPIAAFHHGCQGKKKREKDHFDSFI